MLNFGRITDVLINELGDSGAEAVCDAVSFYLANGKEEFACPEDRYILTVLLMAMDASGLNHMVPDYDPLRHLE